MPAIVSTAVEAFLGMGDISKGGGPAIALEGGTADSQFHDLVMGLLGQTGTNDKAETERAGQQSIPEKSDVSSSEDEDGKTLKPKGTTQDNTWAAVAASIIVPSTILEVTSQRATLPETGVSAATTDSTQVSKTADIMAAVQTTAPASTAEVQTYQARPRQDAGTSEGDGKIVLPSTTAQYPVEQQDAAPETRMTLGTQEEAPKSPKAEVTEIPTAAPQVEATAEELRSAPADQKKGTSVQEKTPDPQPVVMTSVAAKAAPTVALKSDADEGDEAPAKSVVESKPTATGPADTAARTGGSETKTHSAKNSGEDGKQDSSEENAGTSARGKAAESAKGELQTVVSDLNAVQQEAISGGQVEKIAEASAQTTDDSKVKASSVDETKSKVMDNSSGISDAQQVLIAGNRENVAKTASAPVETPKSASGTTASEQTTSARMINQIVKSAKLQTFHGGAEMTLRLDPPHLGSVQMSVSSHEGKLIANLQTSTESAKQILESDLSALKKSLSDSGINVDSINVSVGGNSTQSGGFQDRGSQEYQGNMGNSNSGFYPRSSGGETVSVTARTAAVSSAGQLDFLA